MKNIYLLCSFLTVSIIYGQRNYEQSLNEAKAFESFQQIENVLLETDYVPEYYRLEMTVNPNELNFSGKTTMHFTTTAELNQIEINAQPNLTIGTITYHSLPITNFTRSGNVLTINLPATIPNNQLDSIAIAFSGVANATSSGLRRGFHNDVPVIETISEPWHGSSWWVCKDDLIDKAAKLDVYVTHPEEFKAASNGTLKSVTNAGNGNLRTHWQHNYPIPTYLVAIAVTNYTEYNNSVNINGTNMPIINYVYPETLSNWTNSLDQVPNYISFLSEKWGDYPYKEEKYGHAQWNRGGGMEHSTMSFMGNFNFGLVGHELAHQWFGNQVTCGTWHDIWINEGFAEYGDGLLTEEFLGDTEFINWKDNNIGLITAEPWGSVYNPDADNQSRIFNYRLTYAKGSMAVHLMRFMINNDDLFFQACRDILNDSELTYNYAVTEEIKTSLETSTGMNWDNYFADWIYGEGHPIFDIRVNKNPDSNEISVKFTQTPSHNSVSFFETPFEIEFRGAGGQTDTRRFELTQSPQTFFVNDLSFPVTSFIPNPGFDVICEINNTVLNNNEFETEHSNQAKLYPNPARTQFTIENKFPINEVKIFDATGKIMFHSGQIDLKKVLISTQNWLTGTYMVQIHSGKNVQLKKLLIE